MKYTTELLTSIIKNSCNWREVCEKLGIKPATGSQTYIKNRSIKDNIDFSHFNKDVWNKGKKFPTKDIEKFLALNGPFIKSHDLKLRLIKCGKKLNCCEICKLTEWMNEPIVLELDHINSNHYDNRIENLQILCSNCHAIETRKRRIARKKAL